MFFVFYILVFITFQVSKINSFSVRREINQDGESQTLNEKTFNSGGAGINNGSNTSPYLFRILQNLTQKSSNLKYHVYDKMLSDELLSIKQHIYDKEARYPPDRIASKSNVPTPTLEIKRKWPVMNFLSKLNKNKDIDEYDKQEILNNADDEIKLDYPETNKLSTTVMSTHTETENNTLSEAEVIKEEEIRQELVEKLKCKKTVQKVIGLRSLYSENDERQLKSRRCSCDNKNSATSGPPVVGASTHKCTRCSYGVESSCDTACAQTTSPRPLTTCSHSSSCTSVLSSSSSDSCGKCARVTCTSTGWSTQVSYSVFPFYMPLQYPMQTQNPMAYYFTTESEDYEFTRKPKHHSTKRHKVDYYYYDDNSRLAIEDDYLEYSIKKETKPPVKGSCRDVLLKEDYTDKVQKTPKQMSVGVYDVSRNKFVNEVVQDLKMYYPEAVVKECYCKSSAVRSILSFYFILIVFFRLFNFFSMFQ